MPRRPRSTSRGRPRGEKSVATFASSSKVQLPPKAAPKRNPEVTDSEPGPDEESGGDDDPSTSDGEEDGQGPDDDPLKGSDEDEDSNVDADAPRVAQWVDEEDLEYLETPGEAFHRGASVPEDIETVQDNLASLPFGTLRRAQRALARAQAEENQSDSGKESLESESEPEEVPVKGEESKPSAHNPEWSNKPRTDIAKRSNKNAPVEVTSKKPVTRRREIVEVPKTEVRDPRFLPFTGKLQPQLYKQSYGFLSDMHKTELSTLKENLKRARRMLRSSPHNQREEREQEVAKLEQAFKRAESNVNRDKREKIEEDALQRAKQEEKERRKTGKRSWYMKESEKRTLLVKARYDALAAEGGKRAVRNAIQKKQKKIGQKEKKSRPFESKPSASRKRTFERNGEGDGGSRRKRIRTQ